MTLKHKFLADKFGTLLNLYYLCPRNFCNFKLLSYIILIKK